MPHKDPEERRRAVRESMRRARQQTGGSLGQALEGAEPVEVGSAADLLRLLCDEIAAVRADSKAGTLSRARVVAQLASPALRCLEAVKTDERLAALEARLAELDQPTAPAWKGPA